MKFAAVLVAFLAVYGVSGARIQSNVKPIEGPDGEYCSMCVSFMGQALNELLEIILNAGVIGSCGDVCDQLPNSLEATVCSLLCDYVGLDAFISLVDYEDPDPIYACEILGLCSMTGSGAASTVSFNISPTSGPQGTTFTFTYVYQVTAQTSTGLATIFLEPPSSSTGQPISDAELIANGQAPGSYNLQFQLQAQPSEGEPFGPGQYLTQIAICAGDCSGVHEDSGVYCQAISNFTITQ